MRRYEIRICKTCEVNKPNNDFYRSKFNKSKDNKLGLFSSCKKCVNIRSVKWQKDNLEKHYASRKKWHENNKERVRESRSKKRHGISLKERKKLFDLQGGLCLICIKKLDFEKNHTHYDHDHKTGKFRGFLCNRCNLGIGLFEDDIKILSSAITYLDKNEENKNGS